MKTGEETKERDCYRCGGKHTEDYCPLIMDKLWIEYRNTYFGWSIWDSVGIISLAFVLYILILVFVLPPLLLTGFIALTLGLFIAAVVYSWIRAERKWQEIKLDVYKKHIK